MPGELPDRLRLEGMEFFGHHGDLEAERQLGVRLRVDVEMALDLRAAGHSDRLEDTVDYVSCCRLVRDVVEDGRFRLLEAVAERIAAALLGHAPVRSVCVRVTKRPALPTPIAAFTVVVERSRGELGA